MDDRQATKDALALIAAGVHNLEEMQFDLAGENFKQAVVLTASLPAEEFVSLSSLVHHAWWHTKNAERGCAAAFNLSAAARLMKDVVRFNEDAPERQAVLQLAEALFSKIDVVMVEDSDNWPELLHWLERLSGRSVPFITQLFPELKAGLQRQLKDGRAKAADGDLAGAIAIYESMASVVPTVAQLECYCELAKLYDALGRVNHCTTWLGKLILLARSNQLPFKVSYLLHLDSFRRDITGLCAFHHRTEWAIDFLRNFIEYAVEVFSRQDSDDVREALSDAMLQLSCFSVPVLSRRLRKLQNDSNLEELKALITQEWKCEDVDAVTAVPVPVEAIEPEDAEEDYEEADTPVPSPPFDRSLRSIIAIPPITRKSAPSHKFCFFLPNGSPTQHPAAVIHIRLHHKLIVRTVGKVASMFIESEVRLFYESETLLPPPGRLNRWAQFREHLAQWILDKWIDADLRGQIVLDIAVWNTRRAEFTSIAVLPLHSDQAFAKRASEFVGTLNREFFASKIALPGDGDGWERVELIVHLSCEEDRAMRHRTHPHAPYIVRSAVPTTGILLNGFSVDVPTVLGRSAINCDLDMRDIAPIPPSKASMDHTSKLPTPLKQAAGEFADHWAAVLELSSADDIELIETVQRLYAASNLKSPTVVVCGGINRFLGEISKKFDPDALVNNKLRERLNYVLLALDDGELEKLNFPQPARKFSLFESLNRIWPPELACTTVLRKSRPAPTYRRTKQSIAIAEREDRWRFNGKQQLLRDIMHSMWGPWETAELGKYEFIRQSALVQFSRDLEAQLDSWSQLHRQTLCALFMHDIAFLCRRPEECIFNARGVPHNESGPAVRFRDEVHYWWNGMHLPHRIMESEITVDMIEHERNVELRRVLLERYGVSNYMKESKCEIVARDEFGVLIRRRLPNDEPIMMVRVKNSTVEPDGSWKTYFLRVPPEMKTPREAVAWSFGVDPNEYDPAVET